MKTLLICRPRTRSTVLIDALSKFYNLIDLDENQKFSISKFQNSTINSDMEEDYFSIFQGQFKQHVQKNFKNDNFAIKLYPRMLTMSKHTITDLNTYNLKIITDLSYFTNIKKYDSVFYLTRDLIDSVCSWAYGNHIDYYNFRDQTTLQSKREQFPKLTIDIEQDGELKFYMLEAAILQHWKSYLIKNNIPYTELDYTEIPEYVTKTCPNIQSKTIDSKLNYQEIITNYNELEQYINNFYEVCLEKTQHLIFT